VEIDQAIILDNYRVWLQRKAADLISDRDLQQDLAQEGWVAMWQALQTYDESRGALPAWLTMKALGRMRYCARDKAWLGRPGRHQGGHNKVVDVTEYPVAAEAPLWDTLEAADLVDSTILAYHRGEIMTAIAALTVKQREYVYLRFWRGYRQTELTEFFGYNPLGLWYSPVNGARLKLRKALDALSTV
jgi:DNA-directed RNA polymerase specialized sigma24 family protein